MKTKKDIPVVKCVYPSSGVPFSTRGYRAVIPKVIAKLEHHDDQEIERKRKRNEKGKKGKNETYRWNSELDSKGIFDLLLS